MAIKNRQEQRLHSTATRKDMSGVRRAEGIDEGSHVELAYYPSTKGKWATGLICCIGSAMRPPFRKFC
jgi:hypothetical protein